MTSGLRRELEIIFGGLIFVLLLGSVFGHILVLLCLALVIYLIWTLYNLNHLHQWLSKPSKHTPESLGVWDDVYYQLYNLYKRQRKSRKRLSSILQRFQKSTQALPYATVILNSIDEIEWFNPAASHMFSFRSGRDIGQRIDNLIRQPEFASYLAKKSFKKPLKFTLNNRKIILTITEYGSGQYLLNARDITRNSQLDEMRRDFISNASHELRTPLTVMSGYIEALQEQNDQNLKMPLEKIQQQTIRMEKIISELIGLAKLESAEIIETPVEIDSNALLKEVFNEALALDQNKHSLSINVNTVTLSGNYDELRMAFSNLLTNAIRYTPEGGTIELFTLANEAEVCVGVRDSGIGIDYQHIPRLTERFYRVDEGRSREKGGTGLGLAIVNEVLERHGATLRIESTLGKGSVFSCCFPKMH